MFREFFCTVLQRVRTLKHSHTQGHEHPQPHSHSHSHSHTFAVCASCQTRLKLYCRCRFLFVCGFAPDLCQLEYIRSACTDLLVCLLLFLHALAVVVVAVSVAVACGCSKQKCTRNRIATGRMSNVYVCATTLCCLWTIRASPNCWILFCFCCCCLSLPAPLPLRHLPAHSNSLCCRAN